MGMFERVGSNWFLDTLGKKYRTHNEPFRQQLHRSHILSTLNEDIADIGSIDPNSMHPFERYWIKTFVLSKYSSNPQAIKESNLFFATNNFLQMFPYSQIIALTRDPVGIVSSFTDKGLYDRWQYDERYRQLSQSIIKSENEKYLEIIPPKIELDKLRKLSRLIALNGLLLAAGLSDRKHEVLTYENAYTSFLEDSSNLPIIKFPYASNHQNTSDQHTDPFEVVDETYSTSSVSNPLTVSLDTEEIKVVKDEIEKVINLASILTSTEEVDLASSYLIPDHKIKYKHRSPKIFIPHLPGKSTAIRDFTFIHDRASNVSWRNTLVNNNEFGAFLNKARVNGINNIINGSQLLFNENMPCERGGRIYFDEDKDKYAVISGYEYYPVYWVTWLGAAAFARYTGCSLPTSDQLTRLANNTSDTELSGININHRVGDVVPAGTFAPDDTGIFDKLGNLSVWCENGPNDKSSDRFNRYIFGLAWNSTQPYIDLNKMNSRPITGCSRSVGIRLVLSELKTLSTSNIAVIFHNWYDMLGENPMEQHLAEEFIINSLTF